MVKIAFQNEVRESFSKIKEDMLNIKRNVNRELLAIEKLSNTLQSYTTKEEFYSFVKRLDIRLEKIEAGLVVHTTFDDQLKEIEEKFKTVNKRISIKEDLKAEVKEVRKLRGRLAALEGSAVDSATYNKDLTKIFSDLSLFKKSMLTDKEFNITRDKLADLSQELKELRDSTVNRESFDSRVSDLRKNLSEVKNELEMSVSEVDISDYVTKESLTKKFTEFDKQKLKKMFEELKSNLSNLKKNRASLEEVNRIGSELAQVKESLNDMEKSIKKESAKAEKLIDERLKDLSAKFSKELNKIKSDYENRLKKTASNGRSESKALMGSIGKGISSFFKEEAEQKQEIKKHTKK